MTRFALVALLLIDLVALTVAFSILALWAGEAFRRVRALRGLNVIRDWK